MSERLARPVVSALVGLAIAVVIVAAAVLPFLNPAWVAFAQDRAEAAAWTGYTSEELRAATDGILTDLVLGPPAFDVVVSGQAVLNPRERGHMADVRSVFAGFALLALASVVVLAAAAVAGRRSAPARQRFWRAARGGAAALAAGVVVVGLVGVLAFDLAFEAFHRLFFAGGTYTFDPSTERLVQLFPQRFWFETSLAVGLVILVLVGFVVIVATRRLRTPRPAAALVPGALETAR